jgi:hypothetical protein
MKTNYSAVCLLDLHDSLVPHYDLFLLRFLFVLCSSRNDGCRDVCIHYLRFIFNERCAPWRRSERAEMEHRIGNEE